MVYDCVYCGWACEWIVVFYVVVLLCMSWMFVVWHGVSWLMLCVDCLNCGVYLFDLMACG